MFRREVIERVGLYDERLARTEDNDYFYRVREAGYKIRFDVRIQSKQIARSSLKRMLKQKYGNGYWIGRTMYVQPKCFRAYHFAPFAFVLGIILLACVGFLRGWAPFVACAALYAEVTVVLMLRVNLRSETSAWSRCRLYSLVFMFRMASERSWGLSRVRLRRCPLSTLRFPQKKASNNAGIDSGRPQGAPIQEP